MVSHSLVSDFFDTFLGVWCYEICTPTPGNLQAGSLAYMNQVGFNWLITYMRSEAGQPDFLVRW